MSNYSGLTGVTLVLSTVRTVSWPWLSPSAHRACLELARLMKVLTLPLIILALTTWIVQHSKGDCMYHEPPPGSSDCASTAYQREGGVGVNGGITQPALPLFTVEPFQLHTWRCRGKCHRSTLYSAPSAFTQQADFFYLFFRLKFRKRCAENAE